MRVRGKMLAVAAVAALLATGGVAVATPASAKTSKATGKATITFDAAALSELRAAGVTVMGANGPRVTWPAVSASFDASGDYIFVDLRGQLAFSRDDRTFRMSALRVNWEVVPDPFESYGGIGATVRGSEGSWFNLTRIASEAKVTVDKAKRTRTLTVTMSANVNLSVDYIYAGRINRALDTDVFTEGMLLGAIQVSVRTTVACQDRQCTK